VSTFAAYLTGELSCGLAAWVPAHYKNYRPTGPDPRLASWRMTHTEYLALLAAEQRALGERIYRERQNYFQLALPSGTIAGMADLATSPSDIVWDVKTGQPKASHIVQVMLYQWALPRVHERYRGRSLTGAVVYPGGPPTFIPPSAVDAAFEARVLRAAERLLAPRALPAEPSRQECRFCAVPPSLCPERVEWDVDEDEVAF
jgi:hypothetical protein